MGCKGPQLCIEAFYKTDSFAFIMIIDFLTAYLARTICYKPHGQICYKMIHYLSIKQISKNMVVLWCVSREIHVDEIGYLYTSFSTSVPAA